jgi:acyl carrier protein
VLDDGVLQQQNWERFERVFAPKVRGGWNLHQLTRDAHLDFFVLFSSISSLFNPAGQGNYSAANTFLDILAHHRSIQGLPALSINWGAWSDVGMMATRDSRDQERWMRMGVGRMTPEQGVEIFAEILNHKSAQLGITPIDWKVFKKNWSPGKNLPYLRRVDREEIDTERLSRNRHTEIDILQKLKTATRGKRRLILRSHIIDKIRAVLGHDSSMQIEYERALEELGFDSLMSVQLRNALVDSLKVNLPTTLVYDYPTVEALTDFISQGAFYAIFSDETEKAENADDDLARQAETKDERDIEILSEEDANAFLLDDLEKLEKKYLSKKDD